MYSYLGNALSLSLADHVEQVLDVGMYVTVRKQTDEMHGGILALNVGNKLLPGIGFVHLAALNALVYELGALGVDLTAADSIVADLGVTHVVVGGKSYGVAVSL